MFFGDRMGMNEATETRVTTGMKGKDENGHFFNKRRSRFAR